VCDFSEQGKNKSAPVGFGYPGGNAACIGGGVVSGVEGWKGEDRMEGSARMRLARLSVMSVVAVAVLVACLAMLL
jgi:hypothetical protein